MPSEPAGTNSQRSRGLPNRRSPGGATGHSNRSRRPMAFCPLLLVSALLGLGSLSCATIGHRFPPEKVREIEINRTTKTELLGMFGLPYRRGIEDSDSTWTYLHYKIRLLGEHLRTRDLYVRFDESGTVRSFTYNSNMEE
jgi:hypothetical protein